MKEYKQASSIVNKLVGNGGMTPIQVQATLLKGWIDLTLIPKNKNDAEIRTNSVQYFENVIKYVLRGLCIHVYHIVNKIVKRCWAWPNITK